MSNEYGNLMNQLLESTHIWILNLVLSLNIDNRFIIPGILMMNATEISIVETSQTNKQYKTMNHPLFCEKI